MLGDDPKARLQLKEHPERGVFVDGLEEVVGDVEAINKVMARGEKHRTVGHSSFLHKAHTKSLGKKI